MTDTMADNLSVAVLGTGIMGAGMARSLLRQGIEVRVWNRTREKAEPLSADGARVAKTPADAVRGADVILTMLFDDPAVLEAINAAAPGVDEGQIWLQSSTVGVASIPLLAEEARRLGLVLVDAPVLGTRRPAELGQLIVFAAGPVGIRELIAPVLDAISERVVWLGDSAAGGAATRLKLVVNSWVLALVNGVAEALSLAEGLGLDPRMFLENIAGGALDSPYLRMKAGAMLDKDFSANFALETAEKDARLIVDAGVRAGLQLDVAAAVAARLGRARSLGHGHEDLAATYFASHPHS